MSSELKLQSIQSVNQGMVVNSKVANVQDAVLTTAAPSPAVENALTHPEDISPKTTPFEKSPGQQNDPAEQRVNHDDVRNAVKDISDFVQSARREIQFSVDEVTGRTVVRVYNHETKELIRQIPADEILKMAQRVNEYHDDKGYLFESQV